MDYAKIYSSFIADRNSKPEPKGYTEKHHIVPRSLGGSDDAENLIALTPEDHFFAHLLLAKVHGGKMSAALFCMLQVSPNHWGRRMHSRGRYGLAKRIAINALSEAWTGEGNPLHNETIFEWLNYRTGEEARATLLEMHRKHGMSRGQWTMVAAGYRPSIKGWLIKARAKDHKKSEKGQIFAFVNRDGREFSGTQHQFCAHTGLSIASSSRVVNQQSVTRCGWRRKGVANRAANSPREGRKFGPAAKEIVLVKGDEMLRGDRKEIAEALGSTPVRVSAAVCAMKSGKVKAYKGWVLQGQK